MTKNELAKQINHTADVARTMSFNYKLDLQAGQLYNNMSKAESWTDIDEALGEGFICEIDGDIEYVFLCNNVPCHKVDYDNEAECDLLDCHDCENEAEVLVPADTKMRITAVSTDEDFAEMGYYEVTLEIVK